MTVRQLEALLDGFVGDADGLTVAVGLVMRRRKGCIEQRILRIVRTHTDGLFNVVDGLVGSSIKGECATEKAVRSGEVWVEIEGTLKFLNRLIGAAPGEGHKSQREMCPGITVVEFHRPCGENSQLG